MKYLKHVLAGVALAVAVAAACGVIWEWWENSRKVSKNQVYFPFLKVIFNIFFKYCLAPFLQLQNFMRVDISFNTEDIHDSETTVPSLNREKTENLRLN